MKRNITKGVITEIVEDLEKKSDFMSFLDFEESKQVKDKGNYLHSYNMNFPSFEKDPGDFKFFSSQPDKNESIKRNLQSSLENMKMGYENIIKDESFSKTLLKLKELETKIIQLRCMLNMDIKLTTLVQKTKVGEETEYVLVRAPFYRPGYKRQEISVYMGKTEDLGSDLEKLRKDSKFMKKAEETLFETMLKETVS